MSFEPERPRPEETAYYEGKPLAGEGDADGEEEFRAQLLGPAELFDQISEAHYLPELAGPHDEALLESLVEKGCEDNQILGQALDKLAHLVGGAEYGEDEDDLLAGAPVADIIDRLERSLESPGRSSITAAQGLLHLHRVGDRLPPTPALDYLPEAFEAETASRLALGPEAEADLRAATELMECDENADKNMASDEIAATDMMYADPVPETGAAYGDESEEIERDLPLPEPEDIQEYANDTVDPTEPPAIPSEPAEEDPERDALSPVCVPKEEIIQPDVPCGDSPKDTDDPSACELVATDLSIKTTQKKISRAAAETTAAPKASPADKIDELPRDLSVPRRLPTPHASPRRIDIPRAPSRESDAMQSPQPSGIPAVPSSPEIFPMPPTKSKQTLFLETLLSSPSPKMYTSEVTVTKQQCEPLNLGKHRKSASPTVTSCSDEMRKLNKEFGEPQEKRIKKESSEDLAKIAKAFSKTSEDQAKALEKVAQKIGDDVSPLKQLHYLKGSGFNLPDPILVPKDRLNLILVHPAREIPALLMQRPELRLPEAFAYPSILQDPDILVISVAQLENILLNDSKKQPTPSPKPKEKQSAPKSFSSTESQKPSTPQPDQTAAPKPIPSMDALAGDIEAATSAALSQMLWLPYISQMEAVAACSQNQEFMKAFQSSGYTGQNYAELQQMLNASRFMNSAGFPMMPPVDYDGRLQFAMWQEAMNQANAMQRSKSTESKDAPSKSTDVQNPYVHSTKSHQSKSHSSARTSPIAHNYNGGGLRSMGHNPFLQGVYPGMSPAMRPPGVPLPGLQIPYFPGPAGGQRSPRGSQQKSPTSPYFPNNNYLQSVKHSEMSREQRGGGSQESPRPRISVKSLQNLLEPAAAPSGRRGQAAALGRRRDEPEVGSTTPLGEPPPMPLPHPHDPAAYHLWHPLFGNQKGYNSPWSWTTVTATGD